jgi:hypothetical protein
MLLFVVSRRLLFPIPSERDPVSGLGPEETRPDLALSCGVAWQELTVFPYI